MTDWSGIERKLNERIVKKKSVGGGCIGNAYKLSLEGGRILFAKFYQNPHVAIAEKAGLVALGKNESIRGPDVVLCHSGTLVLEWIEEGRQERGFMADFGHKLALLHKNNTDSTFGFANDNFIGSTVQKNRPRLNKWNEFYWNNRLLPQYRLAEQNGLGSAELTSFFVKLEKKIGNILGNVDEPPALIHGDLWSGNFMCDTQGEPVLIDPAAYFGNREAELAMCRLFGGFSEEFYRAYHMEYPLLDGYEYRLNIYKLYHLMNHLNLFGHSYYHQVIEILRIYL